MKRRDFLKTAAITAATLATPAIVSQAHATQPSGKGAAGERPSRNNMVIDFESHYIDAQLLEKMKKRSTSPFYNQTTGEVGGYGDAPDIVMVNDLTNLLDVGAGRISHMDNAGIDIMCISTTVPLEVFSSEKEAVAFMPGMNDRLAETVAKHPTRLKAMAAIAPFEPQKAAAELKRCFVDLKMAGWHLHSHFLGDRYPDHELYDPIWKTVADLGIPVYLHPTIPVFESLRGLGYPVVGSPFGFAVDATIALVRLINSGLFEKYPGIKLVTGHMGEAMPFLVQRMDHQIQTKAKSIWHLPKLPGDYLRSNVLYSTSGCFSKEVFECLRAVMGIDRIVFASDWAYEDLPSCTDFVDSLNLSAEEFTKLYSGNAKRELGIM